MTILSPPNLIANGPFWYGCSPWQYSGQSFGTENITIDPMPNMVRMSHAAHNTNYLMGTHFFFALLLSTSPFERNKYLPVVITACLPERTESQDNHGLLFFYSEHWWISHQPIPGHHYVRGGCNSTRPPPLRWLSTKRKANQPPRYRLKFTQNFVNVNYYAAGIFLYMQNFREKENELDARDFFAGRKRPRSQWLGGMVDGWLYI